MNDCHRKIQESDKNVTSPQSDSVSKHARVFKNHQKGIHCGYNGFSLVELIAVIAVIVVMLAMMAPAISGFNSSSGRRGAVNTLMNTFEQARVAALESGQNVYVAFGNDSLPNDKQDMYFASFIVFRDATDEEMDPNGDGDFTDGKTYVVLKKWTKLPKNVAFKRVANSIIPPTGGDLSINVTALNKELPGPYRLSAAAAQVPGIVFNSTGTIEGGGAPLQLFLYEGYFANNQDNFTRGAQNSSGALFEKIAFSRFTGRAQLDVTAL